MPVAAKPLSSKPGPGSIYTQRITCRDRFVEILNTVGDFAVVDYSDIRSIRPATVAQTSVVNARGEFLPVQQPDRRTADSSDPAFRTAQAPQAIKRSQVLSSR